MHFDKVLERFYLDITRYILDEISLVIVPDNEAYIDYLSLKADFAKINNDVSNEKEIYLKILEYSPKHITATAKLCGILFDQRDFTNLKIMSENLTKLTHDDNPYVLAAKMVSASGSVPFKGDEA